MLQFASEHPYVFGVILAVVGIYALVHVLWLRPIATATTADVDDD